MAMFGARIFTADPARPRAEALAIAGGRICALGTDAEVREHCGLSTEVIDGAGRSVIPGVVDAHAHPPMAGVEMARCDLTGGSTRGDYLALVGEYAAANPGLEWLRGGGWSMAAFPGGVPVASDLDAAVGNRAVFLPNRDHHSAWVSSRALELAGIDASTPDPPDGRIERDAAGRPTGTLHEGAMTIAERLLPELTRADLQEGILAAQAYLHSLGVTSWQDAWVPLSGDGVASFEAYLDLAASGGLTARVVAALWWERERGAEQIVEMVEARARAAAVGSDRFRATSVKIMQDGVCETFTAAMLTPYLDVHGHETGNCGLSFVDPEALKGYVTALDAEGFQVHVHALGDRAVREALDAVEAARAANPKGERHHLAHLQVVHPDDLDRFRALRVTPNFQPLWACAEPQMVDLTMPFLGPERSAQQYPIGSLWRRQVPLAFGSDWPVSSPDPLAEMHVAVNRTPSAAERLGDLAPFFPDERIPLEAALTAFTAGSAYVNHLDGVAGVLDVGMAGDVVVLDRDLFACAGEGGLEEAKVLLTMVGGKSVYEAAGL